MANKFQLPYPDKMLTGHFGKIRTINGKKTQPHRGTDWGVPRGTPIPAVSAGTVMLVQFSKVLGWVLVQSVKGYDGKVMYVSYCHMDTEPTLKQGDKLKIGQTIGKIGNTGMSSGPHLHATLSPAIKGVFAGTVVDLYKYLSDQIKNGSAKHAEPQISPKVTKKETKPAVCPNCGQEVKK
ncbi:MAG: M23 family metallopeptidase [Actinobacteria bacterium]|nr:M23 family metallopeptidase [Actinomycetota bacterium]